jgi:hypothetical protein
MEYVVETNTHSEEHVEHRNDPTPKANGIAKLNEDLQHAIDQLGAAVLRVKKSQTVEDQASVEDLEARYMALRRDFESYRDEIKQELEKGEGGTPAKFEDRASDVLNSARDRFGESYSNLRDYLSDEDTKARFKQRSKEVRDEMASAWSTMTNSFKATWDDLRERSEQRAKKGESSNGAQDETGSKDQGSQAPGKTGARDE